jgi:hypothetical protein
VAVVLVIIMPIQAHLLAVLVDLAAVAEVALEVVVVH